MVVLNRMKRLILIVLALSICLLLISCSEQTIEEEQVAFEVKQLEQPKQGDPIAIVDTSKGEIRIVLFDDIAPKAYQNLTALAKDGYYNELTFHRVLNGALIQAGDHTGVGDSGKSIFSEPYENEPSKDLFHFTGAVGIANAKADQNLSQFYIISDGLISSDMITQMEQGKYPTAAIEAYKLLGGRPTIDGEYTIVGQVYQGLDVVKEIAAVKTDEYDRPERDVVINSITIDSFVEQSDDQDEATPEEQDEQPPEEDTEEQPKE